MHPSRHPRLAALLASPLSRQLAWFMGIGVMGTAVYFGLYNLLRLGLAPFMANAGAVALSMGISFFANRRLTFGRTGRRGWARQAVEFTVVFGVTLAISSGGLAVLFAWRPAPGQVEENLALLASSGALFVVRFWLLRVWVFHPTR